jgi:aminopeptidase N
MTTTKKLLSDYTPPQYTIPEVAIDVTLDRAKTEVTTHLTVRKNGAHELPLILDGISSQFVSISVDGVLLGSSQYLLHPETLEVPHLPERCIVTVKTVVIPTENRSGLGLYCSGPIVCTQMEAEGFHHLTYFPDRPDVMSTYTVTIQGDEKTFPVLLSNGNCTAQRKERGQHIVTFHDPFPKPCYLFALVGGDLALVRDTYTTASGKSVALEFYVEHGNEHLCGIAMQALKDAMAWDERVFGLEYDLDTYRIVSVNDFNAGAMENKGLNIFNNQYVLADTTTATDNDIRNVQRVIAHEYFHNYTGNRVTCQSWFHLTLKEGLTVFRDQEFCGDIHSPGVERIRNVLKLRASQFIEDEGPNAHPIRPDAYEEIDNFYTATVYNKGAEVIRMCQTLLGRDVFIKGVKRYLALYDGQAVTVNEFLTALHQESGYDFTQFFNWYTQAGTPSVRAESSYEPATKTFHLTFVQECLPTPQQREKLPFVIPLSCRLLSAEGEPIPLNSREHDSTYDKLVVLNAPRTTITFKDVPSKPVLSRNRGFSAPIRFSYPYREEELITLLAHEEDPYARYEAWIELSLGALRGSLSTPQPLSEKLLEAIGAVIASTTLDNDLKALLLAPPSLTQIVDSLVPVDYRAAKESTKRFMHAIGTRYQQQLAELYHQLGELLTIPVTFDGISMGARSLRNVTLSYLLAADDNSWRKVALSQVQTRYGMNESFGALSLLCQYDSPERSEALAYFKERWENAPLLVDKWFAVQAGSDIPTVLDEVEKLLSAPLYDRHNPNKIRSLIGAFAGNLPHFHREDGKGYQFVTDQILEIDRYNPLIASRLATSFVSYRKLDSRRKSVLRAHLERILASATLSRGVREIVSNTVVADS